MIKSMTGFGRGEADSKFGKIVVELRTLNHRFFELSSRLPESCLSFEEKTKELIQKVIRRGKVILLVSHHGGRLVPRVSVDKKAAKDCYDGLVALQESLSLKGNIELSHILTFPSLIQYEVDLPRQEHLWKPLSMAVKHAINRLVEDRRREGKALFDDISRRLKYIMKSLVIVEKRIPAVINRYRNSAKEKFNGLSKERLNTEVAVFSKNCDVTEEVTRMKSHLEGFKKAMLTEEEVGKKLDFIAQELHREATTIGSKACDYKISREVIEKKSEIEKIREQVQNIE
ncbi:MAG: YicC family protein [Candidatus Omnitrophica bacterium]|nr:YicC family protein [Candidatus Omnitrophota bacterium]